MTCEEMIDFVVAWREDRLPPEVKAIFDAHMAACPCCEKFLNNYCTTASFSEHLSKCSDLQDEDCPEELIQGILAARKGTKKP